MRVLLLSPLLLQTGNNTSSHRIKNYLIASGYEVDLQDCYQFESSSKFNEHLKTSEPDCILAVHAYRSGALLQECTLPFALVFGGTDLNEHFKIESKMRVMTSVVHKAKYMVTFSKPLYNQAKHLWPDVSSQLVLQPQAVKTSPDGSFNFVQHLQNSCNIHAEVVIFLLLAGLRPVKDVLYLTRAFSEWHLEENAVHLVIAGPELDGTYSDQVKQVVNSLPGVYLLPEMSLAHAHTAIKQSYALLNSSQSEGMSSTILEAMDLQVPVIARDIPGNKAIITHGETGLLFNTPMEFIQYAKCLRQDVSFRKQIIQNAKEYLIKNHSTKKERGTYCRIVAELISTH
ncbi:glycosyltransferase 1 domain-containing protein 1-like isoform X2 [Anneissia japonica]|uniref:glycosyltransferase 1 domain-containing protein 1-like isoform X2 n=1 Tax=Anneissia japonica TaxID=1529436 RepID=UPI0014257CD7|nr:glycosyltransferase 1 domain-containing protein 1-like isoform X2 [Anneissia japonica]XP_033126732.1 glycosyltransferase 1 domain-containing protein 1-like isoform X2 [Anneissia japonica]XP_033126733.1 glycosyltransferase 1 domain-containing protein 1-like isoform X2 [Anneissia japonica]XP_033126734.1 glycosyltransferase 1 domain-containing protein 1-like isoform X2 [Anneissia japonica]XP_033126735.1 glycosyltransferase 1 domain-containing protein 1-like isoform X2 [Anneissia japonica]XP_03